MVIPRSTAAQFPYSRWLLPFRPPGLDLDFRFALPLLPDTTVIKLRLDALWTWIQANE